MHFTLNLYIVEFRHVLHALLPREIEKRNITWYEQLQKYYATHAPIIIWIKSNLKSNIEFLSDHPVSMSVAAVKDRRIDALGDLRFLPDEILCAILTTLTPHDVARLSCVSR